MQLKEGGRYYLLLILHVLLVVSCGTEPNSSQGIDFNQEPIISKPTNLRVKVFSAQEIRLFWVDNSNSEEGFIVEKSLDNQSFVEISRVASDTVTFSDFTTAQNQHIYYRIAAYQGTRSSTYSEVVKSFHYVFDSCLSSPAAQSSKVGIIYPFTITGLNYFSDYYSSVTDLNSSYAYGADKVLSFSIGYIPIAQINAKPFMSLGDMVANINRGVSGANNVEMNLLRLLLALDSDNNSTNGIQLPCHLSTASGDIDFSLDAAGFESQGDVISILNGKMILSQLQAMALLRSAKNAYYSGNYRIYYSEYASGFLPSASGSVDFTLNTDGGITMNSFSGDGLGWIKAAVFLPDDTVNNLYFRAGDTTFYYDLRIDANIEPDRSIVGTFRVFGLLGDVPGSATGLKY